MNQSDERFQNTYIWTLEEEMKKKDNQIADLKAGLAQMEEQWNRLQDWLQVLLKAHEYYREAMTDAMECIDCDEAINAYDYLDDALNNKDYIIEWKDWKPENEQA